MKTAIEILNEMGIPAAGNLYGKRMFSNIDAMKAYAEEVLREAAERATVEVYGSPLFTDPSTSKVLHHPDGSSFCVYKPSILSLIQEIKQ